MPSRASPKRLGSCVPLTNGDGAELMLHLQESLANSFFRLGLSERQESFIQDLIGGFAANMAAVHNRGTETQDILSQLISRLSQLQRGGQQMSEV